MRRPSSVELMLLTTVVLWALNLTVSRYILTHGMEPLAYSTMRYGAASLIFLGLSFATARTPWFRGRDLRYLLTAAVLVTVNQVAFVFALETTTATTMGLILGATPIFVALLGLVLGFERVSRRFWLAAVVSFAGVALVAVGSGGELSSNLRGALLGTVTAASWAGYSIYITPLMERHSPVRVSAAALSLGWIGMAVAGARQTLDQELRLGWEVWALFAFATLGPLVVTNILWFGALSRIGPARATLAANLMPFVATVFAVILLSEGLTALQVGGGALVAAGILLARRRRAAAPGPE